MKTNKKLLIILSSALLLCGCNPKTSELYKSNAYNTGNFDTDYYTKWDENLTSSHIKETKTFDISSICGNEDSLNHIKEEDTLYKDPDTGKTVTLNWDEDYPIAHYGTGYGPTKNLGNVNSRFEYGVLSKLYDGRVRCGGFYAASRVQLNKTGYGCLFPVELQEYKYFGMCLKGGCSGEAETIAVAPICDFKLTFYKFDQTDRKYIAYEFDINNKVVPTNCGGVSNLISFYFDEVDGLAENELVGVTGMSLTYSMHAISEHPELTDDMTDTTKSHFGVFLYEVLLPESKWR